MLRQQRLPLIVQELSQYLTLHRRSLNKPTRIIAQIRIHIHPDITNTLHRQFSTIPFVLLEIANVILLAFFLVLVDELVVKGSCVELYIKDGLEIA